MKQQAVLTTILTVLATCSLAGDVPSHEQICPDPPYVVYFDDNTEVPILAEELVGVWYVTDFSPVKDDVGEYWILFVALSDEPYPIDQSLVVFGELPPMTPQELEEAFLNGALPN